MFGKKNGNKKFKCSQFLEGDGIESRLPFKIFSTLQKKKMQKRKENTPAVVQLISYENAWASVLLFFYFA